jgi:hypothetical protein
MWEHGVYLTYHQCVVVWCCDRNRDEALANGFQHLANSLASSRPIKLLGQLRRDVDWRTKFDDGP